MRHLWARARRRRRRGGTAAAYAYRRISQRSRPFHCRIFFLSSRKHIFVEKSKIQFLISRVARATRESLSEYVQARARAVISLKYPPLSCRRLVRGATIVESKRRTHVQFPAVCYMFSKYLPYIHTQFAMCRYLCMCARVYACTRRIRRKTAFTPIRYEIVFT